ncbi:cupin domain-containing protein [Candidatus Bipolaricaulota bacterium]|nr:cupin domain-containing protein [Candidatus Bipolaricaulota bacterium]
MGELGERIGERLAALRRARGLTLTELAARCGLSASFLSQVERGVSAPSIVSLYRICQGLGIPVSQVLPEPGQGGSPVRQHSSQPPLRISEKGATYLYLSGDFPGRGLEALINEFPPGYRHPMAGHDGEEFGYVLSGDLALTIEDRTYMLGPGDSFHFPARRPHSYHTRQGAKVLIVSTQRFIEGGGG